MKKYIVIIMMLIAPVLGVSAQTLYGALDVALVKTYNESSPEEKEKTKDFIEEVKNRWKKEQVKEICGVRFGEKQEIALELLKGKFGDPYFIIKDHIMYKGITYGNIRFEVVSFQFQSDGIRTYMNGCVFISREENNTESLLDDFNKLSEKLKKYDLVKLDEDLLYGGVSPLWDGDVNHIDMKYTPAIILSIVKNEKGKYRLSLIYGHPDYCPYN